MTKLAGFAIVLGVVVGCAPASNGPAVDSTFGSYARMLGTNEHSMGRLPKSLEKPDIVDSSFDTAAHTSPPMWYRGLRYDGLLNDEICFQQMDSDIDLRVDAEERGTSSFSDLEMHVELLTELPGARPIWPSSGPKLGYKGVAQDETKVPDDGGPKERTVHYRLCAPAPATANARYLAVIVHHTTPIGHNYPNEELLLWELQ